MWTIEVEVSGNPPLRAKVRKRRVLVGRAADNDLVVSHDEVSGRHLVLTLSASGFTVEDLASTNGTFVDGERVVGRVTVAEGQGILLGGTVTLTVRGSEAQPPLLLEDRTTGAALAIERDRFVIGPEATADLQIADAPTTVLLVDPDGELWLGRDGEEVPLAPGTPFSIGGHELQVVRATTTARPTAMRASTRYPYVLTARRDGPTGVAVALLDTRGGAQLSLSGDNRAVLLYLLALQHATDEARELPAAERGWCSDHDLQAGIWGRRATIGAPSGFGVLVHRVRRHAEKAGFDPWFLEKRRGRTRVRVLRAEVDA